MVTQNRRDLTELWYRATAKNVMIFALKWLGAAFLPLLFVKWVIHGSAALYLLLVPWTLLGSTMVVRSDWIMRATRAWKKDLYELESSSKNGRRRAFPKASSTGH